MVRPTNFGTHYQTRSQSTSEDLSCISRFRNDIFSAWWTCAYSYSYTPYTTPSTGCFEKWSVITDHQSLMLSIPIPSRRTRDQASTQAHRYVDNIKSTCLYQLSKSEGCCLVKRRRQFSCWLPGPLWLWVQSRWFLKLLTDHFWPSRLKIQTGSSQ